MCTSIAANAASALSMAQLILLSNLLALGAAVTIVSLSFRNKLKALFSALPRLLKL